MWMRRSWYRVERTHRRHRIHFGSGSIAREISLDMPSNQSGILESIKDNKESLALKSAELLTKEEELRLVKTPKTAKSKGALSRGHDNITNGLLSRLF